MLLTGYQLDRSDRHDTINAHMVERGAKHTLHGEGEGALSAFIDALMKHSKCSIAVADYREHVLDTDTMLWPLAANVDGWRAYGVAWTTER